ncbi:hypothetical protein P5673_014144 [Acropora cervicornis]|uniref:Uncharacterized protein n=1 Tax=Acropora cervicornis TaxID=6130 RepID=A0AAD9QKA1_ACRCE|nr:hypothetical protein P5673_014144 [Acropora cervicornis]
MFSSKGNAASTSKSTPRQKNSDKGMSVNRRPKIIFNAQYYDGSPLFCGLAEQNVADPRYLGNVRSNVERCFCWSKFDQIPHLGCNNLARKKRSVPGANGDIFCGTLKLAEIEAKIMEP